MFSWRKNLFGLAAWSLAVAHAAAQEPRDPHPRYQQSIPRGETARDSQPTRSNANLAGIDVEPLAKWAIDDFVAACVVRPRRLIEHKYLHTLPIWRLLPNPVTFSRIDEMGIHAFALFCGATA